MGPQIKLIPIDGVGKRGCEQSPTLHWSDHTGRQHGCHAVERVRNNISRQVGRHGDGSQAI